MRELLRRRRWSRAALLFCLSTAGLAAVPFEYAAGEEWLPWHGNDGLSPEFHTVGPAIVAFGLDAYSHTRDGGMTWSPTHPYPDGQTGIGSLIAMYYPARRRITSNAGNAIVCGDSAFYQLTDSLRWRKVINPRVSTHPIDSPAPQIFIIDRDHFIVSYLVSTKGPDLSTRGDAYYTGNGGESFSMMKITDTLDTADFPGSALSTAPYLVELGATDSLRLWGKFFGSDGLYVARSRDGGSTWESAVQVDANCGVARSLKILDDSTAFFVADQNFHHAACALPLRTVNGGRTWDTVATIMTAGFNPVTRDSVFCMDTAGAVSNAVYKKTSGWQSHLIHSKCPGAKIKTALFLGPDQVPIAWIGPYYRPLRTTPVSVSAMNFIDKITPATGNPYNQVLPGRLVQCKVEITNNLEGSALVAAKATVSCRAPFIHLKDNLIGFNNILQGTEGMSINQVSFTIDDSVRADTAAVFDLSVIDEIVNPSDPWVSSWVVPIRIEPFSLERAVVGENSSGLPVYRDPVIIDDDNIPDSKGDNDDICESGETIELRSTITHSWPRKEPLGSKDQWEQRFNAVDSLNLYVRLTSPDSNVKVWKSKYGASGLVEDVYRHTQNFRGSPIYTGAEDYVFDYKHSATYAFPVSFVIQASVLGPIFQRKPTTMFFVIHDTLNPGYPPAQSLITSISEPSPIRARPPTVAMRPHAIMLFVPDDGNRAPVEISVYRADGRRAYYARNTGGPGTRRVTFDGFLAAGYHLLEVRRGTAIQRHRLVIAR